MPGRTFCSRQEMPAFRWCACTRLVESPPTRPHWSVRRRPVRECDHRPAGYCVAAPRRAQESGEQRPRVHSGGVFTPHKSASGAEPGPTREGRATYEERRRNVPRRARRRSPDGGAAARGPGGGAGSQWPVGSVAVTVSGGRRGGPGGSP